MTTLSIVADRELMELQARMDKLNREMRKVHHLILARRRVRECPPSPSPTPALQIEGCEMGEMTQQECLAVIDAGEADAYDLLVQADPTLVAKFKRVDRALIKLLKAVRQHFPDAEYYTGSGGFNLMLGSSHDDRERGQQRLVAIGGNARISDGDF